MFPYYHHAHFLAKESEKLLREIPGRVFQTSLWIKFNCVVNLKHIKSGSLLELSSQSESGVQSQNEGGAWEPWASHFRAPALEGKRYSMWETER